MSNLAMLSPPTDEQKNQARVSLRLLSRFKEENVGTITVVQEGGSGSEAIAVPAPAFRLFIEIVSQMARGNAVILMPHHAELTTQQAADFLNVSRPYLVGLLEQGKIRFHKVGTRRRVRFVDLLEYRKKTDEESRRALDELVAEAQEYGLGY